MKSPADQTGNYFNRYLDWYGKHGQICKDALMGNLRGLQAALQDPELISQRLLLAVLPASGLSPFLYACMGGNSQVIDFFLKQGANINERDNKGATALMLACYHGHDLVARQLMKQGADIFARSNRGNTVAMAACMGRLEDLALYLLDLGVEAHPAPPRKENLLNLALVMNQTRLARRLIADAKALAQSTGQREALLALINDAGGRKNTPLLSACNSGLFSLAMDLIDLGANLFARNNRGEHALYICCANRHRESTAFCKKLIALGLDPNSATEGHSCLSAASCRNYLDTVKLLVQSGTDVNSTRPAGHTPLYLARYFKYKALTKFLLQSGALR